MEKMFSIDGVSCPVTNRADLADSWTSLYPKMTMDEKSRMVETMEKLIPKGMNFVLEADPTKDFSKKLLLAAKKDQQILLVGPKGTGKTTSIYYIAQQTNNPLVPIQLNGATGVDTLIGKWLVNKEGTYRVDGLFTMAWKYGFWIVLDELNMCVDAETEVLTLDGWKRYEDLSPKDRVATMEIEREVIEYHKPKEIKIFDWDGDMVHLKGSYHEQLITPNHRVMYKEKHIKYKSKCRKNIKTQRGEYETVVDENYKFSKIEDMNEVYNGLLVPISAGIDRKDIIGKDKAKLLCWILTDGCLHKSGGIYIYQSWVANKKKCLLIEGLLENLGIKYTKKIQRKITKIPGSEKEYDSEQASYYLGVNEIAWVYEFIDKKKLPIYGIFDSFSEQELYSLYEGMMLGDGDKQDNITIGRKEHLDRFEALLVHIGKSCTIAKKGKYFTVSVSNKTVSNLVDGNKPNKKEYRKREHYKGKVWCLTIENSNFLIRRKDEKGRWKASFTGNCLPEITAILHPALDDRRVLVLDEKNGEVVERHPNTRIFSAINPTEDYAGTKEMNLALVDRFAGQIIVAYPEPRKEREIVLTHKKVEIKDLPIGREKEGVVTRMVKVANALRKLHEEQKLLFECSTRNLIDWACRSSDLDIKEACDLAILSKADKEDRKQIRDEVNKYFKDGDRYSDKPRKANDEVQDMEVEDLVGEVQEEKLTF